MDAGVRGTGVGTPKVIEDMRREAAQRAQGYRERALRVLPHICASCSREFEGRRLRELTVHHKDHNHDNNPPDGSNWELLCIYCHEFEHEKGLTSAMKAVAGSTTDRRPSGTFQALAALDVLLTPPESRDGGGTKS